MIATDVFTFAPRGRHIDREAVVAANAEAALAHWRGREAVTFHTLDETARGNVVPGLTQVEPPERVVAIGRAAHTTLADVRKRTLMTSAVQEFVGGDPGDDDRSDDSDLERLIWSCVNTSRVVAVGRAAWRSIQLLPVEERRFHEVPPLQLPLRGDGRWNRDVLVIDHEADAPDGRDLVQFLLARDLRVEYAAGIATTCPAIAWCSDASTHIHVGRHTIESEDVRLVDSWRSRRLTLQIMPLRSSSDRPFGAADLLVEHEANGFRCASPDEIVRCHDDAHDDVVLRRKLVDGGLRSVAPLIGRWSAIAEDLLS